MHSGDVVVFEADDFAACSERALLLHTQGIASEVAHGQGRCRLWVSAADAETARRELDDYRVENAGWPPRHAPVRYDRYSAWPGVVVYALLMCLMALIPSAQPGGEWFAAGKVDAALILSGEWWRAITALTLHVDIAHLTANLVFGAALGYFAGQYFGSGLAWLAILAAGAAGNALNSLLLTPSHTSVGASTAIFAALGMIAAFAWRRKFYPQDRWAYRLGPVIAGVALLAYTGTGGERTDVSAHVTGFISGFASGALLALTFNILPRGRTAQWAAGLAALGILGVCWTLALAKPI